MFRQFPIYIFADISSQIYICRYIFADISLPIYICGYIRMQSAVIRGNFADWDTQLSHAISLCASISGQSYVTHSVTQILPPPMLLHTQKYGARNVLLGLESRHHTLSRHRGARSILLSLDFQLILINPLHHLTRGTGSLAQERESLNRAHCGKRGKEGRPAFREFDVSL